MKTELDEEPAVSKEVLARRLIHTTLVQRTGQTGREDAVVLKEHVHYSDGTVSPELRVLRDPTRRFYVTKPGLRHPDDQKKEWEDLHNLDEYVVKNSELAEKAFQAINGFYPRGHTRLTKVAESPYLYGADISIETLIKIRAFKDFEESGVSPAALTTGMLDTESSMMEANYGELIMATVTHENRVYTAVQRKNFFYVDSNGNRKPGVLDDLKKMVSKNLDPDVVFTSKKAKAALAKRDSFIYEIEIVDNDIEVIKWIMRKVHENKTDFLGVWNLPFDMGLIIRTCKKANLDPAKILCNPDLPEDLQKVRFFEDPGSKQEHFSRRWHWLYGAASCQWYDAMCLYSILRTVRGLDPSYSLDSVLKNNDITDGKLKFTDLIPNVEDMTTAFWHRKMQSDHPYEYIVYSIFDSVSLQVMEWVNSDTTAMHVLIGSSPIHNFNKQTRRSGAILYEECLERGKIIATTSSAAAESTDAIRKEGGAVLPPDRAIGIGMPVITESGDMDTLVHTLVSDIDLSAIYPNATMGCNVSRETKVRTMINIEGHPRSAVRDCMSLFIDTPTNAVAIGSSYFGLPDYVEMEKLFERHIAGKVK